MKTSLIIVAAGKGERFGQPKALVQLAGKSLLEWNLQISKSLDFLNEIIVVISPEDSVEIQKILEGSDVHIVDGGRQRTDSVRAGVSAANGDILLIHNVANPLASPQDFKLLHQALLKESLAAYVGQPVVDTLRRSSVDQHQTIPRENLWRVQTPQAFRKTDLLEALENGGNFTDEIACFEGTSIPIKAFPCSSQNFKITFPEDLELAEQLLNQDTLFGVGEDSHRFDTTGTLVLSGVEIEDHPKLKGNSDADVVLHAIFNAVSSALGKGSIAPTADPMCKEGITDSAEYLKVILNEMSEKGYQMTHLSISLECLKPKIEKRSSLFKDRLSELLDLDTSRIGITATSGEALTSFGKEEGIKCLVTVVLSRFLSHA